MSGPPSSGGGGAAGVSTPWLAYRRARPAPRVRLFCFPYAGGGASVYRSWADELPSDVEVCPVQPPGREARIREAPAQSMDELVTGMLEGLAEELDRGPHAMFGHSLGAVAAYELARRRRDAGLAAPVHLFASAHLAPQVPWRDEPIHDLPSPELRERLRQLDGTPAEVLEHPELMELLEPLLRADFRVNETYRHLPGEPLTCPVTAFGGTDDPDVSRDDLERWADTTRGPFRLQLLPGDHFFLAGAARATLLTLLSRALLAS